MAGRFSVEAVFKAVDRITAPVSRMQNRVGRMARTMGSDFDRLNKTMGRVASGAKKVGAAIVLAAAASTGALANVAGIGIQFEQTLVNAAVKFPGEIRKGTAAFAELEAAARKTGSATEFSASNAAEALNFLAMAGFSAKSAISALPGVVDLATSAQVDLATATDVASDTLGAFSLMSKDPEKVAKNLARVNDVIAKTTTSANTTVRKLFETIKEGGPVATSAGSNIETFAALAGKLADAGIKGGQAGTVLKNMFANLQAPTSGAAKNIKKLGVTLLDNKGDLLDIVQVLGQFEKATAKLGKAKKAEYLRSIFGMEALAGVNVLMAAGSKEIDNYRKSLVAANGTAAEMAGVMRDTLQGRINSLKSAVEGVKISLFKLSGGALSDTVDKMTEWVRVNETLIVSKIESFIMNLVDNFQNIVKWAKRIAIGIAVFFVLGAALKSLALILTVVNLVMAANPIVLLMLAIAAAIAIVAAAVYWFDEWSGALRETGPAFDIVVMALAALTGPIGWFVGAALLIVKHWEPIKKFFADLWDGIVKTFDDSVGKVLAMVQKIKNIITALKNEPAKVIKAAGVSIKASVAEEAERFTPKALKADAVHMYNSVATFFGKSPIAPAPAYPAPLPLDSRGQPEDVPTIPPQMISPQERTARSIEETRSTSTAEVTIRDETGRAEVTSGTMGAGIELTPSGAF